MRFTVLLLGLCVAACDAYTRPAPTTDAKVSVVDDNRRTVSLERPATRVISLVPAATSILRALDAKDVLIARTTEDTASKTNATVGSILEPSIERIVALQPDLVIAWADADNLISRLAKAGVTTYGARFDRITAAATQIRRLGALVGKGRQADVLADDISAQLALLRSEVKTSLPPKVLYLMETNPIWTTGPDTFVDDMITLAGGRNVFNDLRTSWSQVSLEAVVARRPDIIVVARRGPASDVSWLQQPGWRAVRAVRMNRVHFVDANSFHQLGPEVVENVRHLAGLLSVERSN